MGFHFPLISNDQKKSKHVSSIPDRKGMRLGDALHVNVAINSRLVLSILNVLLTKKDNIYINILQKVRFQEPSTYWQPKFPCKQCFIRLDQQKMQDFLDSKIDKAVWLRSMDKYKPCL